MSEMLAEFTKDPDAVLDYSIDWAPWLAGDAIVTSTWEVPAALSEGNHTNTGTVATAWVGGGEAGQTYRLTNRITTAGGRTDDRSIVLRCEER